MARGAKMLAGRYELLDVLGRGGMGVVYRARDRMLDRIVAVKVLPAEYSGDETLVARFEREARAVAGLSHPNIVAVFDTGRDGSVRYFVMECVPGLSLTQILNERGALPVAQAVGIAAGVAAALAVAHGAGIVHRDIKPGNIMVDPAGLTKVLDFGIAHASTEAALTRTTAVLGSAPYMAPEMALGHRADARSDIYSLGCVLFEMLTDRPPFRGELPEAIIHQHLNAEPPPVRDLQADVPPALGALVAAMLAKSPDDRPQAAGALATALRAPLDDPATAQTVVLPRLAAAGGTEGAAGTGTPYADTRVGESPRRRRPWVIAAALLAALAVGVAVAIASTSGGGSGEHTTTRTTPPAATGGSPATSPPTTTATTMSTITTQSATRPTTAPHSTTRPTTTSTTTPPTTTPSATSAPSTTAPGTTTTPGGTSTAQ